MPLAELLFWVSFAVLFYVYAGYPFLLAAIAMFVPRRRPKADFTPRLSILIAAYNEQTGIRRKIEQTLALDYPSDLIEILVLSDGSTDQTDAIVESFRDPRVRLLQVSGRKGKTNAQNEGVKIAHGDVLIFSDATTIYHPQALRYLASNYADPKQSRIRTISGCCGCIYSVRREAYTPLAPEVISDLVQPLHVIRQGYRVAFEERALAYEETTQSTSEEFSMRVRVVTRGIWGLLSLPELLMPWKSGWVSFQLWSHKVLRWLVPFFLFTLLASNLFLWGQPFYRLILLGQMIFYVITVLSLLVPIQRLWKPLAIPLYFCTLNAAAFCSVIEVLRGKKHVVWETVRT